MPTENANANANDGFSITVTHQPSGDSWHLADIQASSERQVASVASETLFDTWKLGPAPTPIPVFTLEVSDHGRDIDSSWSSLELAQAEAQRIHDESETERNATVSDIVPSSWELEWDNDPATPESAAHWRVVTYQGHSGNFGFSITRTTLDQPRQF